MTHELHVAHGHVHVAHLLRAEGWASVTTCARWLLEQGLLGRDFVPDEERYWQCRQYGWSDQEFDEWAAKREAWYEANGGKEQALADQARKSERMRAKWERRYGD